ncbi:MAG: hypothetical protein BWY76_02685 [bacterium ADurb.Bin429]|nr:MAG: hypothetical protein BWY76_02685 [bacterium ADurb.Bin429]
MDQAGHRTLVLLGQGVLGLARAHEVLVRHRLPGGIETEEGIHAVAVPVQAEHRRPRPPRGKEQHEGHGEPRRRLHLAIAEADARLPLAFCDDARFQRQRFRRPSQRAPHHRAQTSFPVIKARAGEATRREAGGDLPPPAVQRRQRLIARTGRGVGDFPIGGDGHGWASLCFEPPSSRTGEREGAVAHWYSPPHFGEGLGER